MFRRRRRAGEEKASEAPAVPDEAVADEAAADKSVADKSVAEAAEAAPGGSGPWDAGDAYPDVPRVDLGGLLLPVGPGFEIQLNVAGEHIVGATVLAEESALHLQALAAPRRSSLWDEVRAELAREVAAAGGKVEEREGPFGLELTGTVPTPVDQAPKPAQRPGQKPGQKPPQKAPQKPAQQAVRYIGIDGPRWLLRAVLSGRATIDEKAAETLEGVLRDVVVVRGDEPMAPRDLIELRLPSDARQAGQEPEVETFRPFERGPEISEIR